VGYVFGAEDAQRYDEWMESAAGQVAIQIEKELLLRIWRPAKPERVLEVGCGTGVFLGWLDKLGHQVTGLEPSPIMLNYARNRLPEHIPVDRGYAENLPYDDNAFDTVVLITTLEFVENPLEALSEAFRVARKQVVLGSMNKYSLLRCHRYLEQFWKRSIYSHAHFFSVFELKHLARQALLGQVPIRWRTCLALPLCTLRFSRYIEGCRYFQWHPFGHFIAMRIDLSYPLQTVQDPLFRKLPAGIGPAHLHPSCWQSPTDKTSMNNSMRKSDRMGMYMFI
jgi:ubiquinone/menaquinone biosynthesis C-methylase UbiE